MNTHDASGGSYSLCALFLIGAAVWFVPERLFSDPELYTITQRLIPLHYFVWDSPETLHYIFVGSLGGCAHLLIVALAACLASYWVGTKLEPVTVCLAANLGIFLGCSLALHAFAYVSHAEILYLIP